MLNQTTYGTGLCDVGTSTTVVRVLCADRLLELDLCADEGEVSEVLGRWSDLEDVSFLVDGVAGTDPAEPLVTPYTMRPVDAESPIASAPVPAVGTE